MVDKDIYPFEEIGNYASQDKPPIGIEPETIWKDSRIKALCECIGRNSNHITDNTYIWVLELQKLLAECLHGGIKYN